MGPWPFICIFKATTEIGSREPNEAVITNWECCISVFVSAKDRMRSSWIIRRARVQVISS